MTEAIVAYRHVAASPEFREMERVRSKARHDEAQAIYNAEMRGVVRGAMQRDEHWQGVVVEKDTAIAEKDNAIAEKDALIAKLQKQLQK